MNPWSHYLNDLDTLDTITFPYSKQKLEEKIIPLKKQKVYTKRRGLLPQPYIYIYLFFLHTAQFSIIFCITAQTPAMFPSIIRKQLQCETKEAKTHQLIGKTRRGRPH